MSKFRHVLFCYIYNMNMVESKEILGINQLKEPDFSMNGFFDEIEKIDLYNKAKDAYYNGEEIMSDLEFDELESELGLENKGYVGSKSKHYTVQHPLIMGSIEKVQVKFEEDGTINFDKYIPEILKYLKKANYRNEIQFETTPKLDGCSWEAVFSFDGELISVSTRGDGNYGKNLFDWFITEYERNFKNKFQKWIESIDESDYMYLKNFVIRGECLVRKDVFMFKYSQDFTIPRSFVSGVLNQDWVGSDKQKEMRDDLCWVCYDYREIYDNGRIIEINYDKDFPGTIIDERYEWYVDDLYNHFQDIYESYEIYRNKQCPYCLDGIVIKPIVPFRLSDNTRSRQEDSVAVKFTPEVVETQIEKIEWKVGKNSEYYPTAICKEVILGGKKVSRVSLHNYDYIVRNGCGIDASIILILSGDIIPQCYKITNTSETCFVPDDSYVIKDEKSGCLHLIKNMSNEEEEFNKFINSVKVIKPDGIGEQVAKTLYFNVLKVSNILSYMTDNGLTYLVNTLDNSKSSKNIINALIEKRKTITLTDIIESEGFKNCGKKNSLWLAKKLSNIDISNDGIPSSIIELFETNDFSIIYDYMSELNVPFLVEEKSNKIPVILTGKPTQYSNKKDFLIKNPQYIETTSWKECKILFTDSLESTSSKMKKAKQNKINIQIY